MAEEDRTDGVTYLNNAGQAPLSPNVRQAGIDAVRRPPWEEAGGGQAVDDQRRIRQLFAGLIGAKETDVAIVPSTSFAVTLAAHNIERDLLSDEVNRRKGRILVLQDQMCSAVYPWQDLCRRSRGRISLEVVPYPDDEGEDRNGSSGNEDDVSDRHQQPPFGWTRSVLDVLEKRDDVLVACLPPLHWSDGSIVDLEAVSSACRKRGIRLVVDATQAVGAVPVSVSSIRPALLACSVHKWLRAPHGTSLVYVDRELHPRWEPLDEHGRSRLVERRDSHWDAGKDEMGPNGYPEPFVKDARKFDSGGKANPILLPMLRASLEEVAALNVKHTRDRMRSLMAPLLDWTRARRDRFALTSGPRVYHLVGIRPRSLTPEQMVDVSRRLREQHGICIAVRCGAFRISPYLNNREEHIQRLMECLDEILRDF